MVQPSTERTGGVMLRVPQSRGGGLSCPTALSSGMKVMPSGTKPMVVMNTPLLCLSAEVLGAASSARTSSVPVMARSMTPEGPQDRVKTCREGRRGDRET